MAKLPPKTSTPSIGKKLTQNRLPPANILEPDAYRAGSGSSCTGKSHEANWVELLNPGQPYYGNRCIEGMYRMLFDNKFVYKSYYEPRVIPGLTPAANGPGPQVMPRFVPMDLILRSANQACHLPLVKPHERALVHLAAIVSPCGLLLATDDLGKDGTTATARWCEILFMRNYLLSPPLIRIKGAHMEMGNTLAAVLDQSYSEEDVDLDQVTRLAIAVQISDSRLSSYWTSQIESAPGSAL